MSGMEGVPTFPAIRAALSCSNERLAAALHRALELEYVRRGSRNKFVLTAEGFYFTQRPAPAEPERVRKNPKPPTAQCMLGITLADRDIIRAAAERHGCGMREYVMRAVVALEAVEHERAQAAAARPLEPVQPSVPASEVTLEKLLESTE